MTAVTAKFTAARVVTFVGSLPTRAPAPVDPLTVAYELSQARSDLKSARRRIDQLEHELLRAQEAMNSVFMEKEQQSIEFVTRLQLSQATAVSQCRKAEGLRYLLAEEQARNAESTRRIEDLREQLGLDSDTVVVDIDDDEHTDRYRAPTVSVCERQERGDW